jgi:transcription elongation factor GreA
MRKWKSTRVAHPSNGDRDGTVKDSGTVQVGSWVEIQDGQLPEFWQIVAAGEGDALRRRMSEDSPLARALIGHRPGDRVSLDSPGRRRPVEVISVGG